MAVRWLETYVGENNIEKGLTKEELRKMNCLKNSDVIKIMCTLVIADRQRKYMIQEMTNDYCQGLELT